MLALNAILLLFAVILRAGKAQADIKQPITPKISWTNVGIEVPNIVFFFETDFKTKGTLTSPWLKIDVPWLCYKMNAEWAMIPINSCSTDNLIF